MSCRTFSSGQHPFHGGRKPSEMDRGVVVVVRGVTSLYLKGGKACGSIYSSMILGSIYIEELDALSLLYYMHVKWNGGGRGLRAPVDRL